MTVGMLANDTDVERDALTVTGITGPGYGTVVINGDETITYTPAEDYRGTDSLTYSDPAPSSESQLLSVLLAKGHVW